MSCCWRPERFFGQGLDGEHGQYQQRRQGGAGEAGRLAPEGADADDVERGPGEQGDDRKAGRRVVPVRPYPQQAGRDRP